MTVLECAAKYSKAKRIVLIDRTTDKIFYIVNRVKELPECLLDRPVLRYHMRPDGDLDMRIIRKGEENESD